MKSGSSLFKVKASLVPLSLFLVALLLRMVKAGFFSLGADEMFTVDSSSSFGQAIERAHADLVPPFVNVINTVFYHLGKGSLFWQRLPVIVAGALACLLFYKLLAHFHYKKPFLLSLLPATSFILVFYSQELRPYSYLLLLTLASLYWGYKIFMEEKYEVWEILALVSAFTLLPIIHYFTFFHLLALNIALLTFILLFGAMKVKKIITLIFLNSFSLMILIPWAGAFARNLRESQDTSILGKTTKLDWELVKDIFYKFSGGADAWSVFIFLFLVCSLIYLGFSLVKNWRAKNLASADFFALFVFLYLIVFLLTFSRFSFGRLLVWRYLLFLIWPFFILLLYGLSRLIEEKKPWQSIGLIIIGLIFLSNLLNTFSYLLAPNRFVDWRSIAQFTEEQIGGGEKKRIILHNFGNPHYLQFYLEKKDIPLGNITTPAVPISPVDKMREEVACCANDIIYIHIKEQGKESGENKILEEMADKSFPHKKVIGQSKYLDFLDRRKVNPYWNYPFGFGGYLPPIVYY